MSRITSFTETDQRYRWLRIVSALMSGIGVILLVGGTLFLIFGVLALVAGMSGSIQPWGHEVGAPPFPSAGPMPVAVGFASLIWALGVWICGLELVAVGTLLKLAIHVEENTRISAQALKRIQSHMDTDENMSGRLFRS